MNTKQECTNYAKLSGSSDTAESVFTIREIKNEPNYYVSGFEGVRVKDEPG